jgi:hypothetical protein
MLVDKKILVSGIVMISVGILSSVYLSIIQPIGTTGMTEEEALELVTKQQENQDFSTLAGILIGVGFMLVLISFGAHRRKGDDAKKIEKKPEI